MSSSPPETLIISLTPVKAIAIAFVAGPWLAIYWSYALGEQYLGVGADKDLFFQYSLYASLLILLAFVVKSTLIVNFSDLDGEMAARSHRRLMYISIGAFFVVFYMAGRHILSGDMSKGDVNINMGFLGPIYTFITNFVLPAIVFCNFLLSVCLKKKRSTFTLLIYSIVFLAAFVTGYKSSVIMIFLPLAACLWPTISVFKKASIGLVGLATIVGSQVLLGNFDGTVMDSIAYNVARSTSVAAYGVLGSWEMSRNEDLELTPIIADSLLGSHLSSAFMTMIGGTNGQMPGDFTKLVTYEYYPNRDWAEAGSVTLTLTLFGELVLLSPKCWIIWFVAFLYIVNVTLKLLRNKFGQGDLRVGVLIFCFCLFGILPAINSTGILEMLSLPNMIYLCLTYWMLKHLLPNGIASDDLRAISAISLKEA